MSPSALDVTLRPRCQVVSDALDKPRNIREKGLLDLVTETDEAAELAILEVGVPGGREKRGYGGGGGLEGVGHSVFCFVAGHEGKVRRCELA